VDDELIEITHLLGSNFGVGNRRFWEPLERGDKAEYELARALRSKRMFFCCNYNRELSTIKSFDSGLTGGKIRANKHSEKTKITTQQQDDLLDRTRKIPPYLRQIYYELQIPSTKYEAINKLRTLCDIQQSLTAMATRSSYLKPSKRYVMFSLIQCGGE